MCVGGIGTSGEGASRSGGFSMRSGSKDRFLAGLGLGPDADINQKGLGLAGPGGIEKYMNSKEG